MSAKCAFALVPGSESSQVLFFANMITLEIDMRCGTWNKENSLRRQSEGATVAKVGKENGKMSSVSLSSVQQHRPMYAPL